MNRSLVLLAALLVVGVVTGFVVWQAFREPPPEAPDATDSTPPVTEPAVPPEPPRVRRELAVTGRVVGPSLAPLVGARIVVGEESATTDETGRFSFPASLRPRAVTVQVLKEDKEVCKWDAVLAGDPIATGEPPADPPDAAPEAAATYDLDAAVVPAQPNRLRWSINVRGSLPGDGGDPLKPGSLRLDDPRWIQLEEVLIEEWGNGVRARTRGRTSLPDGAHIASSLYFDGLRSIASLEPAIVKTGSFSAAMYSPAELRFYSGVFEAHASFDAVLESYSVMESWKAAQPDVDWDSLSVPEVSLSVFSGDPNEARSEDIEARTYYTRTIDAARRLERGLKSSLLLPTDQARVFVEGKGLSAKSVRSGPRAWFRGDFLDPEGKLDELKWRRFIDEEWRPEIRTLVQEHSTRGQEKYMIASTQLNGLLDALLDQSYGFSKFIVYLAFKLEAHPNDFYADEERAGDLIRLERVVQTGFESLERFRHLAE